jgi:mannose-6-phosphate isomerase-like protein (cupin superfamily)
MQVISGAGACTPATDGALTHWVEQLRVPDLSVGTYSIARGGVDGQVPHTEDEIYVVTAGRARLQAGGDSAAVGPGSVRYVPARGAQVHRHHRGLRGDCRVRAG